MPMGKTANELLESSEQGLWEKNETVEKNEYAIVSKAENESWGDIDVEQNQDWMMTSTVLEWTSYIGGSVIPHNLIP